MISRLETIGYGFQKSYKNKPSGNLKRQISRPGRGKPRARTRSFIRNGDRFGVDYSLIGKKKDVKVDQEKWVLEVENREGFSRPHSLNIPRSKLREMNDLSRVNDKKHYGNPFQQKIAKVLQAINNQKHHTHKRKDPSKGLRNDSNKKIHSFQRIPNL